MLNIPTTKIIKIKHRELLEVMDMFINLIVGMVSLVYVYVQTHQTVYVKHVLFSFAFLTEFHSSCPGWSAMGSISTHRNLRLPGSSNSHS